MQVLAETNYMHPNIQSRQFGSDIAKYRRSLEDPLSFLNAGTPAGWGRIERVRADKKRLEQNQRLSQMKESKADILAAAQRRSRPK
jgi:hypothetical protein